MNNLRTLEKLTSWFLFIHGVCPMQHSLNPESAPKQTQRVRGHCPRRYTAHQMLGKLLLLRTEVSQTIFGVIVSVFLFPLCRCRRMRSKAPAASFAALEVFSRASLHSLQTFSAHVQSICLFPLRLFWPSVGMPVFAAGYSREVSVCTSLRFEDLHNYNGI